MKGTALEIEKPTPGEMKEFVSAFVQSTPTSLSREEVKYWISKKRELSRIIQKALNEALSKFWDWQIFFQKYFDMELDLSDLKTPPKQEGFDRLIIVPEGITPNRIYEACAKSFSCWKWTKDLNQAVSQNDRESTETYAIWVRDRREADEGNKGISPIQAKEKKIPGITLNERLIFELKYWDETKEHLDVENLTICSGSRYSDGGVPHVNYYDGKVNVGWCTPQYAHSYWRVRTVVSFQS